VPRLEFALLGGAVTAMLVETVAAVFNCPSRVLYEMLSPLEPRSRTRIAISTLRSGGTQREVESWV
jgi:hypothetical protein